MMWKKMQTNIVCSLLVVGALLVAGGLVDVWLQRHSR